MSKHPTTKRGTVTGLTGAHPYLHDAATGCCRTCSTPRRNHLHKLPAATAEARAYEAARYGEEPPDTDEDF